MPSTKSKIELKQSTRKAKSTKRERFSICQRINSSTPMESKLRCSTIMVKNRKRKINATDPDYYSSFDFDLHIRKRHNLTPADHHKVGLTFQRSKQFSEINTR